MDGVVDTGAGITLIGPEAFKTIAAVAKLHPCDFKLPDKTPRIYDQKTFHIDGRIDMDIFFEEHTMKTPVYVKIDAKEHLLLSEGHTTRVSFQDKSRWGKMAQVEICMFQLSESC